MLHPLTANFDTTFIKAAGNAQINFQMDILIKRKMIIIPYRYNNHFTEIFQNFKYKLTNYILLLIPYSR